MGGQVVRNTLLDKLIAFLFLVEIVQKQALHSKRFFQGEIVIVNTGTCIESDGYVLLTTMVGILFQNGIGQLETLLVLLVLVMTLVKTHNENCMQVNVEKEPTYQHILEDGALLGGKFSLCGHVKGKRTKA